VTEALPEHPQPPTSRSSGSGRPFSSAQVGNPGTAIRDAARQIGLDVRVEIHTGEVERCGAELAGIAVHLARRVCETAQPGDVLVSRTVVDLVARSGMRFDDRGEHELKGIPATWRLFAVTTKDRSSRSIRQRQTREIDAGCSIGARPIEASLFPARTPAGVDLAALVERRLGELPGDGLLFPSPKGHWARRSNYRRNLFDPAAIAAGWPRRADGRWQWTFHSLRHVFATWALAQPGGRIEDVSRLLGHSTVRVTQDLYIAPDADLYDRFYKATG
jgi:Phage integrase family